MKFTVNSTDLLSRLQIVSRVIAPKSTLPILEDVLFDIADGKLTLTASDLDTTLVTTMDLPSADADIKVAISSKMLLETVREFSDQPLEFNINDNNFAIIITALSILLCLRSTITPTTSCSLLRHFTRLSLKLSSRLPTTICAQ